MIKKLTLIAFIIFFGYMAYIIPQVYVAVKMTNEAMDNDPSLKIQIRSSSEAPTEPEESAEVSVDDSALDLSAQLDKQAEEEIEREQEKWVGVLEIIENARITAYTKHDPGVNCISASQKNICWINGNVIACPIKYPFGTIVEITMGIDDVLGSKIVGRYTCLDRMSPSHQDQNHFDIWFDDDLEGALEWGIKFLDIKVLEE